MRLKRTLPRPFTEGQSHLGESDAVDFYYARIPLERMHAINEHIDSCPTCADFYAAVRERESSR